MKNFFITNGSLISTGNEEILDFMRDHDFIEFAIGDSLGYLVDENQLANLREVGLRTGREANTPYDGIYRIQVLAPGEEYEGETIIHNWNGNLPPERVREIIEETFLPEIEMKVVEVWVPHGEPHGLGPDESFNIFIWSSPGGNRRIKTLPDTMFGIQVINRDPAFAPSGAGVPIVDYDNDYVVAELVNGNNLYIHHDLVHMGFDEEAELFQVILEETLRIMSLSSEEIEKMKEDENTLFEGDPAKQQYVLACKRRTTDEIQKTTDELEEVQREIDGLNKKIIKKIREAEQLRRQHHQLQEDDAALSEKYEAEFDELIKMEQVEDVKILGSTLQVFTKTLYCENPKTKQVHEIGKFQIDIPMNGGTGVRWTNLTRKTRVKGVIFQAPYVDKQGKPTEGETERILPELIGHYEFVSAVTVAINFIETIENEEEDLNRLTYWPKKKEEEKNDERKSGQ